MPQREFNLFHLVGSGMVQLNQEETWEFGHPKGLHCVRRNDQNPLPSARGSRGCSVSRGLVHALCRERVVFEAHQTRHCVFNAPGLRGNLSVRKGAIWIGNPDPGCLTNCTADLLAHELAHLLLQGRGMARPVEKAVCDVLRWPVPMSTICFENKR